MSTEPDPQPFSSPPGATASSPRGAMDSFRSWLINDRGLSRGAAFSYVSLCRRVERDLALSLDASVRTDVGLDSVISRIQEEILTDAPPESRRAVHASLMSATRRYAEFLAGTPSPESDLPLGSRAGATEHNLHSSYREMLLEHLFAGSVMRHLWLRGFERMELLKPQVDDGGYDLVIEANRFVRHVQLKASHHGAATAAVNVNVALAEKPSGCVIWIHFDPATLELGPFHWFGGTPGETLPSLASFKVARHPKANAQGIKSERPNIRRVPVANFERLATIEEVVARLFGA